MNTQQRNQHDHGPTTSRECNQYSNSANTDQSSENHRIPSSMKTIDHQQLDQQVPTPQIPHRTARAFPQQIQNYTFIKPRINPHRKAIAPQNASNTSKPTLTRSQGVSKSQSIIQSLKCRETQKMFKASRQASQSQRVSCQRVKASQCLLKRQRLIQHMICILASSTMPCRNIRCA